MGREPCVLAICGCKNSGKTALIEQLVTKLREKEHTVAYIKHDGHEFGADEQGTDSCRMQQAGAGATVVFSKTKYMMVEQGAVTFEALIRRFASYDLILIEGAKATDLPKFEIVRTGVSQIPISRREGRLGIITDIIDFQSEERLLPLNDISAILEFCVAYIKE